MILSLEFYLPGNLFHSPLLHIVRVLIEELDPPVVLQFFEYFAALQIFYDKKEFKTCSYEIWARSYIFGLKLSDRLIYLISKKL